MKNLIASTFLLLFLVSFVACSKDDDDTNGEEQFFFDVSDESLGWVSTFDTEGKMLEYRNATDSVVNLEISLAYDADMKIYADCQRDDRTVQCELEQIAIAFPNGTHPTNNAVFIAVMLLSEDGVRLMPTRAGLVLAAAQFYETTKEIYSDKPDNFEVNYEPDYLYENESKPAITILTKSVENLATGGVIPPKRLVLVKDVGIVEWDDFVGNTWVLTK